MFALSATGYAEMIADLERALVWLESMGVRAQHSRYATYLRTLKKIDKRWREGATRANEIPVEPKLMETAALEASQLIGIARGLGKSPPEGLALKLKVLVGGPVLERDEKPTNSGNSARDCGFELEVAAYLAAIGDVHLMGGVDVVTRFRTIPLFIECKRPSSQKKIADNLDKASSQILGELAKTNLASYGIAAISAAKVDWSGGVVIQGKSMRQIRNALMSWFARVDEDYVAPWLARQTDGRIAAVLVHIPYIGYVGDSPTIVGTELALIVSRFLRGTLAYGDLLGLVAAIGATH